MGEESPKVGSNCVPNPLNEGLFSFMRRAVFEGGILMSMIISVCMPHYFQLPVYLLSKIVQDILKIKS
jgi:hypothetical protein